jgi:AAA domain
MTVLRGKKPRTIEKRLKALFYGEAGAGKTTAAMLFPRPYLIDCERGAENTQYVEAIEKVGGVIFQTTSFDEIVQEVIALIEEQHPYKTLVIDPITPPYNDLIDSAERKVGSDFGRHYGEAKKQWKRLGNLLMRVDCNVIITSHEKNLYGEKLVVMGKTFDGPKGLDYLFDLVIEVQKRGEDRVGVVRKSRLLGFPSGDIFPFSYDEVAKRYGREVLEREAVPVKLATVEQVARLVELLDARKDGEELEEKWLSKAKVESFDEMEFADAEKCIAHLEGQLKPETKNTAEAVA